MITPTNCFAPYLAVGDGTLTVTIDPGTTYLQGSVVSLPLTNVVCGANATTFIYIDLATRIITSNTTGFPSVCYPIATAVTGNASFTTLTDNRPDVGYNGLEFLGFGNVTAGTTTGAISIPLRDWLEIFIKVKSYAISDIAAVRFNGDTGNNYYSRYMVAAQGGATWANTENPSTNLIAVAATGATLGRTVVMSVGNQASVTKPVAIRVVTATGSAATPSTISLGSGEWINSTSQINSVTLTDVSGNNFTASIAIFGKNFS